MESVVDTLNKQEFEEKLATICDSYQILNNQERYRHIQEYLYGITIKEHKFVIFSSISVYDDHFRDLGRDAIRIVRWYNKRPIGTHKRVNRTSNWLSNLKKKIYYFDNSFEDSIKQNIGI